MEMPWPELQQQQQQQQPKQHAKQNYAAPKYEFKGFDDEINAIKALCRNLRSVLDEIKKIKS